MSNRSPCHSCVRADLDKNECAMTCKRIFAYTQGEDWEGVDIPEEFKVGEADLKHNAMKRDTTDRDQKTCSVPECDDAVRARGVCSRHYEQWRMGMGGLQGYPPFKENLQARHGKRKKLPKKKTQKVGSKAVETRATPFEFQVVVDLSFYPKLRDCIFDTAEKFMVPPSHVLISLAGEALAAKRSKGENHASH